MCVHLRNCAQAIVEIDLYKIMEAPFNTKHVWDDIINVKLEWFMLISVLILFLDDKKEKFIATLEDTVEENDVPVLLTNVVESLPPWLLVREWTTRNLYSWPEQMSEELLRSSENIESALSSSLIDKFVICKPGEKHPILLFINNSNRTLRHRISSIKVEFLKNILIELKKEVMYGTLWLIKKGNKDDNSNNNNNNNNFGVFIKNDESSSTPLFMNPMFKTKLLSSRNHDIITDSLRPLLTCNKKNTSVGEWITLDLKKSFSRDLAVFWKAVSPRSVNYYSCEQHLIGDIVNLESEIRKQKKIEEEQTMEINITEERLEKFLSSLKTANSNAEQAIFLTCVWKTCTDKIIGLLSSTADL